MLLLVERVGYEEERAGEGDALEGSLLSTMRTVPSLSATATVHPPNPNPPDGDADADGNGNGNCDCNVGGEGRNRLILVVFRLSLVQKAVY